MPPAECTAPAPAPPAAPLLIDVRNEYEWEIGRLLPPAGVAQLLPPTRTFAELPAWVEAHAAELQRGARGGGIFTYCTGGVRCERFSALLRTRFPGAPVFQLGGGIQRYMEAGEDGGLDAVGGSRWAGRNRGCRQRRRRQW